MRKALLAIAIITSLAPALFAQIDVGIRSFQNQLVCGPAVDQRRAFLERYSPNHNYDFVGYAELNVYNCTANVFGPDRRNRVEKPKRRTTTTVTVSSQ